MIPLAIKRVESDPLMQQDLIGVTHRIKLFDFAHPATGAMKPNRRRMFRPDGRESFLVRLPLAAQVVDRFG